jgi:hypothetical protein
MPNSKSQTDTKLLDRNTVNIYDLMNDTFELFRETATKTWQYIWNKFEEI